MNLATIYSPEHDYAFGGMARFADAGFKVETMFDLFGEQSSSRPVIRVASQLKLWKILLAASRPLSCTEVYARFDEELDETERSSIRTQLGKWAFAGYLKPDGKKTRRKYSIKTRMPKP